MVDLVTLVAVALLAAGVVGSAVPLVPAGPLSVAGVLVYYVLAPPTAPSLGLGWVIVFTLVGATAFVVEHLGGPLASKAGGAETETMVAAGLASLVLLFVVGPLGIVIGTVGVVVAAEVRAGKDPRTAVRAAAFTVAGMLASSVAQLALTLSILVCFLAVVFVI